MMRGSYQRYPRIQERQIRPAEVPIVMVLLMMAGSDMRDAREGALVTEVGLHPDAMLVYSNEHRLVLQGLLWDKYKSANIASISSHKPKHLPVSAGVGASPASINQ